MAQTDEVLDLVDKDDNVVGSIERSVANSDPNLIHREIAVIIFNKERGILLQQRGLHKRIAPGVWTVSAAGRVTKGLTPLEAAHMELLEELGFDIDLEFIEKEFNQQQNESRYVYWYKGFFPEDTPIKMEPEEVADVEFITKQELEGFQKDGNIIGRYSLKHLASFWSKQ